MVQLTLPRYWALQEDTSALTHPMTQRIYVTYSTQVISQALGQVHIIQGNTNSACDATTCPDLVISQFSPAIAAVGKDLVIDITLDNVGEVAASSVVLQAPVAYARLECLAGAADLDGGLCFSATREVAESA